MGSRKNRLKNGEKAVLLIRKAVNGEMSPMDLMEEMDISESGYYALKKYLEYKFQDWIKYEKSKKMWCVTNEAYILPQKTLDEDDIKCN